LRQAKHLFLFRPSQSSDLISYLLLVCAVTSFALYGFPEGGGGIIEKPIILFNLLGINFLALPYTFFLSAIGVFFCSAFFRSCPWWYFAFIVFVLSFFITGERFYQKYFDPYFFIFFLIPAVSYYKSLSQINRPYSVVVISGFYLLSPPHTMLICPSFEVRMACHGQARDPAHHHASALAAKVAR